MPGCLIPSDLEPIWKAVAPKDSLGYFAATYLYASPGSTAVTKTGEIIRTPTLIPQMTLPDNLEDDNLQCVFMKDGLCTIHHVAPAGCRLFDTHMDAKEGHKRSTWMIFEQMRAWATNGPYAKVHRLLEAVGLHSRPPAESRAKLQAALAEIEAK